MGGLAAAYGWQNSQNVAVLQRCLQPVHGGSAFSVDEKLEEPFDFSRLGVVDVFDKLLTVTALQRLKDPFDGDFRVWKL